MGVVGRPHGVHGEISLRLFTTTADADRGRAGFCSSGDPDDARTDGPLVVTAARPPDGAACCSRSRGSTSREAAAALTLTEVRARRDALPPLGPGEYYVSDVIGCEVFNRGRDAPGRRRVRPSGTARTTS